VQIEQFDPKTNAERLRACFELTSAGWPTDHPNVPPWPLASFAGKWSDGFDACPQQSWLATDDAGEPVGCYLLRLPDKENTDRATCVLVVAPARRRAGFGAAMLAHCAERARQAGRSRLASDVRDGSPGAALAAAAGARGGITDVVRVLDIGPGLPARLDSLRAEAEPHAVGYTLLSWVGLTPEEHIDQIVRVHNAMADAPRDAGVEATEWDAERLRKAERSAMEHQLLNRAVVARHDASGDLAALTELATEADSPDWGFQMSTVVVPAHRGHRLGLLVKIAMLELLAVQAPDVRRIFTGNAGVNERMIAINTRLGFEVKDEYRTWELDLTANRTAAQS